MCPVITDRRQRLIAVRDHRRALIRPHRGHRLDHIGNPVRIGDHDLLRLLASKILKFSQHFLCRTQIKRSLLVRILKAFARHDDTAVYLVLRV